MKRELDDETSLETTRGCIFGPSTSITMADENNWTKSLWGENDEIGAANLMSADLTKEAAGLVKEGKVYSLGLILDSNVPAFPPPFHERDDPTAWSSQ